MPLEQSQTRSNRPDVLVVLTSQWRASAFGFAGDPNARTPCLDRLAARSLWVKQAVTPHPFGVFARAAFLTGTRSPANGLRDYYDTLPADARTLAHAFGEAGYDTAFFGKWQLFERNPADPVVGEPHARVVVPKERRGGFGYWEGFESGFLLNDPLLHGSELPEPTRFEGYQSDVLVERFLRFREERNSQRPLFAVLSLDAPHPPYAADASGITAPSPEALRLLAGTTEDPEDRATARRELAGYYAHIEATDRAIGRLERAGALEGGLFAFSSVHGDMHGVDGKFRKGWPHEEAVRVPLLISGCGRRGVDEGLLMSLVDLGPSLLALAGAGGGCGEDGMDLSGALSGAESGPAQQEISMPSVPPFAKQCPYVWSANRVAERTEVFPESGESFTLEHAGNWEFEA
ncbi:sulfatase-like hydrolase/transferase [Pelagicoccus sp. SDUM812005]|uniref:sulfatase-like hydrolase/transferase n=1 Tax=Pelagicoccus sp. SDUM812005 TaxID=3041257 RepID=UPI00280E874D|nr:sulfatase-like hydrolase/transferase [Pelagicoccus sp. SDUM812005]MDQ8182353.1 sulfatase-like hydrolase/transferase [Pelagicoccus sp. SDUM812005]